jgi:predicted DNA-binding transcriptional regulator AlpA
MDNFLERPELIGKLSRAEVGKLFAQVRVLEGAVFAKLLSGGGEPEHQTPASAPSTQEPGPRMLSRSEVAKRIAVSKITVTRMVARETFPAPIHVGSQLRWRLSDIERWERET